MQLYSLQPHLPDGQLQEDLQKLRDACRIELEIPIIFAPLKNCVGYSDCKDNHLYPAVVVDPDQLKTHANLLNTFLHEVAHRLVQEHEGDSRIGHLAPWIATYHALLLRAKAAGFAFESSIILVTKACWRVQEELPAGWDFEMQADEINAGLDFGARAAASDTSADDIARNAVATYGEWETIRARLAEERQAARETELLRQAEEAERENRARAQNLILPFVVFGAVFFLLWIWRH